MRNADDDFAFDDLAAAVVIKWKGQDVSWAGIFMNCCAPGSLFVVDQGKGQGLADDHPEANALCAGSFGKWVRIVCRCARELQCASGLSCSLRRRSRKQALRFAVDGLNDSAVVNAHQGFDQRFSILSRSEMVRSQSSNW